MKTGRTRIAMAMAAAWTAAAMGADTWHVRNGGDDGAAGDSWGAAWATIGKALATAAGGDTILVSNGTYLITAELAVTQGVTLTGIGGAEDTVVARTGSGNHRIFRIAHAEAVLDGFTVSNGCPTGTAPANYGCGIYMSGGGTVMNCRIVGNSASHGANALGGGIYMAGGVVSNCLVWKNGVYSGTSSNFVMYGGGVYMTGGQLVESAIVTNLGYQSGSGLYIVTGIVDRCRIAGNFGDNRGYQGAGGFLQTTSAIVRNSLITGNNAYRAAGGLWMNNGLVENCTVVGNQGRLHSGGIYAVNNSIIRNTILALNDAPPLCREYHPFSGTYRYCVASPQLPGEGNVEADPQFVDPAAGDFRLLPGSACLNAGTNLDWSAGARDLAGGARLPDARVDIGAYEAVPGPLQVNAIASSRTAFDPVEIVFTAFAGGTNTDGLAYYWDFQNDGVTDAAGSDKATVTNVFPSGLYTLSVAASNSAGEGALTRKPAYVKVGPERVYLAPPGSVTSVFPYASWSTAATSAFVAVSAAVHGTTILATNGLYRFSGNPLSLTDGIRLRSVNGPRWTTLSQGSQQFTCFLSHSNASIEGFTINRYGAGYGGLQIQQLGTVSNCWLVGNRDEGGNAPINLTGGGLIRDCLILTNSSRYYGGVRIQNQSGGYWVTGVVENCMILSNQANHLNYTTQHYPGGVRMDSAAILRNCVVAGNLAFGMSGAIYVDGGVVENCTVVGNISSNAGGSAMGGLWSANAAQVRNTVLARNTNIVTGSAANWYREGGTFACSCATPDLSAYGPGNITGLPVFENAGTGDYRLAAGSPGVNQGSNLNWMAGALDLGGRPRIGQKQADMGAYERPTVQTGSLMLVR